MGALIGRKFPEIALTLVGQGASERVNLLRFAGTGIVVLFVQPGPTPPEDPIPEGWMELPGAPGCTGEACAFDDGAAHMAAIGVRCFGVTGKSPEVIGRFIDARRVRQPFLCDERFALALDLGLETFVYGPGNVRYYRRAMLVCVDGVIRAVFETSAVPSRNASVALAIAETFLPGT